LQTQLGILAATATRATERGRRRFRPTGDWAGRLGELAYGIYLLADQTGVDIDAEITTVALLQQRRAEQTPPPPKPTGPSLVDQLMQLLEFERRS